jgi:hypothetical protein
VFATGFKFFLLKLPSFQVILVNYLYPGSPDSGAYIQFWAILDFYEIPLVPVLERKHRMVLVPVSPSKKWNLRSGSGLVLVWFMTK